jgi:hypothetical protein
VTLERRVARAFALDDEGWARHANPWSGWTRFVTVLPALVLAAWSRVWIGWWAVLPFAAALAWTWLNPRAFPPARDDRPWITRGVLGERLWAEREARPVPPGVRGPANLLNLVSAAGGIVLIAGVVLLWPWTTLFGTAAVIGGKLLYIDRMVRLYDAMAAADPALRYRGPVTAAPP